MHVNLGVWDKLSRIVIGLLLVAGVLVVFIWYLPLIQQNQRFRKQIITLNARIEAEEKLGRHLRTTIESVQNDPKTLERLARERLGFARSNETVIRFEATPAKSR